MPDIGRIRGNIDIEGRRAAEEFRIIARETGQLQRELAAANVRIREFEAAARRGGRGARDAAHNARQFRRHAEGLERALRENTVASRRFDRELRRLDTSARQASTQTRFLRTSLRQLRGGLVALAGGVTTSFFVRFSREISDLTNEIAEQTKDLVAWSTTLNTSSREVEVFLNLLRLFGIEGSVINTFFATFARKVGDARVEATDARRAYEELGISLQQLRDNEAVAVFDLLAEAIYREGIVGADLNSLLARVAQIRSARHLTPALTTSIERYREMRQVSEEVTTSNDELNESTARLQEELVTNTIIMEQATREWAAEHGKDVAAAIAWWNQLKIRALGALGAIIQESDRYAESTRGFDPAIETDHEVLQSQLRQTVEAIDELGGSTSRYAYALGLQDSFGQRSENTLRRNLQIAQGQLSNLEALEAAQENLRIERERFAATREADRPETPARELATQRELIALVEREIEADRRRQRQLGTTSQRILDISDAERELVGLLRDTSGDERERNARLQRTREIYDQLIKTYGGLVDVTYEQLVAMAAEADQLEENQRRREDAAEAARQMAEAIRHEQRAWEANTRAIGGAVGALAELLGIEGRLARSIGRLIALLGELTGPGQSQGSFSALTGIAGLLRHVGGQADAGAVYRVNPNEFFFQPSKSGRIGTANDARGGGLTINVNGVQDPSIVIAEVSNALRGQWRGDIAAVTGGV